MGWQDVYDCCQLKNCIWFWVKFWLFWNPWQNSHWSHWGQDYTPLNLLFTGYFPTVIVFLMSEMYLFFPNVKSAVSIWIFLRNLQTTTQVGVYASETVQNFSLIWSLNMSKKIPSKITFVRFNTESSTKRSPFMPLSQRGNAMWQVNVKKYSLINKK